MRPTGADVRHYLLTEASKLSPPLSPRTARRFRNSAKKRDPKRGWDKPGQSNRQGFEAIGRAEEFKPFDPPAKAEPAVRAIAHYLPQFHPFKENDEWWGKGFTEWSNVGKAVPNYPGHYQPHCPIHLGYYDLRLPEIMVEQARIAKSYGIGGFSYYYYWFGGKTLMEHPLEQMLGNPEVDMPFCLTWANENWTRRWDGRAHDVLIAQNHSIEDSLNLLRHIRKYFDDPRYIRIDGKPVFIVYRANIIPNIEETTAAWRKEAQSWGEPDLYLIAAQTFDIGDPEKLGFDAAMEFPPHQVKRTDITDEMGIYNPEFTGAVLDYQAVVEAELQKPEPRYKLFRSSTLSWDNTARNQDAPRIMGRFTIDAYKRWTEHLCRQVLAQEKYSADEKIVFINAWNEWAEGTHLEPDRRYGFAYLQATYDALPKKSESQINT
ncbi:hypothetical protein GS620_05580 [Ruegeria sp. HKCCD6428]|nr:hypothetical protein [Ruegeria sp. HKCCD6428]